MKNKFGLALTILTLAVVTYACVGPTKLTGLENSNTAPPPYTQSQFLKKDVKKVYALLTAANIGYNGAERTPGRVNFILKDTRDVEKAGKVLCGDKSLMESLRQSVHGFSIVAGNTVSKNGLSPRVDVVIGEDNRCKVEVVKK